MQAVGREVLLLEVAVERAEEVRYAVVYIRARLTALELIVEVAVVVALLLSGGAILVALQNPGRVLLLAEPWVFHTS
jgi:hypothetical protein